MNKGPGVLKDVGSLTDGETGSGTSLRIEKKRTHQFFMDASEDSNTRQTVHSVSDTPISTPATANKSNIQSAPVHFSDRLRAPEPLRTVSFGDKHVFSLGNENVKSERSLRLQNELLARVWKDYFAGCAGEYPFLLRNSSNTGEDSINATSLGLGIGNVISTGLNSAKEKNPVNPIDGTIKKVNGDCMPVGTTSNKEIGVASRILIPDKLVIVESSKEILQNTHMSYQNNFPHDVPSLLSTYILDGVPVKYISGSREKTVTGVIKGKGYMCGCNDCKLSKNLNASEFERHAGCKTNHPNSNIYFESGKTIQAVVQELKKTPPDMYFEAIQNLTGSSINPNNFQCWIEYLQAVKEYHSAKNEVAKPF